MLHIGNCFGVKTELRGIVNDVLTILALLFGQVVLP